MVPLSLMCSFETLSSARVTIRATANAVCLKKPGPPAVAAPHEMAAEPERGEVARPQRPRREQGDDEPVSEPHSPLPQRALGAGSVPHQPTAEGRTGLRRRPCAAVCRVPGGGRRRPWPPCAGSIASYSGIFRQRRYQRRLESDPLGARRRLKPDPHAARGRRTPPLLDGAVQRASSGLATTPARRLSCSRRSSMAAVSTASPAKAWSQLPKVRLEVRTMAPRS